MTDDTAESVPQAADAPFSEELRLFSLPHPGTDAARSVPATESPRQFATLAATHLASNGRPTDIACVEKTTSPSHRSWAIPALLAASCFSAGFGLAHASLDRDRVKLSGEADRQPLPSETAIPEATPSAERSPPPQERPEPPSPPIAAPTKIVEQDSRRYAVRRGRVAYLRCKGVPTVSGPIPCPRDTPLEQEVWRVLENGVQACLGSTPRGELDFRIRFHPPAPPEPSFRQSIGNELLPCIRESRVLTTTLAPDDMTVSFRFTVMESDSR